MSAQYFIEVVPTDVQTFMSQINTFQYSVKENIRPIGMFSIRTHLTYNQCDSIYDHNKSILLLHPLSLDHGKGSHGIPGLYFKYDVAALKVIVEQDRENFVHFLVRLCSVIAGIVVISSYLIVLCQLLLGICIKKVSPQAYQRLINDHHVPPPMSQAVPHPQPPQPNNIIANANHMVGDDFKFTVQ